MKHITTISTPAKAAILDETAHDSVFEIIYALFTTPVANWFAFVKEHFTLPTA